MNKLIGVSTSSFYYWKEQKDWINEQLEVIKIVSKYFKRVELSFSVDEILKISDQELEKYSKILKEFNVSLHLPSISKNLDKVEAILERLDHLEKYIDFEYYVLHSDDYAKLKMESIEFKTNIKIGLENSDIRKFGFQHLKDLSLLDKKYVVLDINHLEEMARGSTEGEIKELTKPIIAIHFSSPKSKFCEKYSYINSTHYLYSCTKLKPPRIPKNIPIILEGIIPIDEIGLLVEEIKIVEALI